MAQPTHLLKVYGKIFSSNHGFVREERLCDDLKNAYKNVWVGGFVVASSNPASLCDALDKRRLDAQKIKW